MSKLLRVIRSIWGRYFWAARKAEKRASDLERQLIRDLEEFESKWYAKE